MGSNIAHLFNPAGVQVGGKLVSGNPYGKGAGAHRVQKWFIKYFQDDQGNLGYSDPSVDASIDESKLISKDYRIEVTFWRRFQQKNNNTGVLGNIVTVYPAAGGNSQENWQISANLLIRKVSITVPMKTICHVCVCPICIL